MVQDRRGNKKIQGFSSISADLDKQIIINKQYIRGSHFDLFMSQNTENVYSKRRGLASLCHFLVTSQVLQTDYNYNNKLAKLFNIKVSEELLSLQFDVMFSIRIFEK